MKKMTVLCLVLSLFVFSCTETFAASGSKKGFSAAELKRMSTFLSNFTELGFMDFDAEVLTNEDDPADMIRFGIWHNYINNYKSRIARCKKKNCEWGSLCI